MNNKKVILVIILFIGISFIVYSFANPLTEEENLNGNGANTGISEGNNTGNNISDDDNNQDDDLDKEDEENKDSDEDEDDASNEEKNDDSSNQIVNGSSNGSQTQTKPSTPKYYCKVVGGKYYGKYGYIVNYATYDKECIPDTTIPTLAVNNYVGPVGDNRALSTLYTSSFGKTGGNTSCKYGNTTITNVNEFKTYGKYEVVCTATGNNGKSVNKTMLVHVKPAVNMTAELGSFDGQYDSASYTYRGITVKNNVKVSQNGNVIYVTGTMLPQKTHPKYQSNQHLTLNYVGLENYTEEQLKSLEVYIGSTQVGAAVNVSSSGKSYISIKRGFMEGDVFTVKIDWGDGNGLYSYEVHYDVKVLTIDEIEAAIDDQLAGI